MNSKQIMLLTAKNFEKREQRKEWKKGRKITTYLMVLIISLLFSCMSVDGSVACDAKEKTKVTKEVKDSKKNSRKKKAGSKKGSKKKSNNKKNSRKKKSFRERYTVYGTPEKNSFKSYMSYRAVSSSSAQGKLQAKAKTDSKTGIRKVDGRYCVALGSYYCSKIGTKIDLVMENGSIVKCILADQKANRDTDAKNQKTSDGSIAEFLVDMDELPSKVKTMGNVSYASKELKGEISKVRVYE